MHEPLRQRIAVQYHLDALSREELDALTWRGNSRPPAWGSAV
jgi:hypothetical protein